MATTQIQVTALDNEIILIAIPASGLASVELFHYSMGYGGPVNVTIRPGLVLPTGDYTLSMIGINWGGPSTYSVTVTTDGVAKTYTGGGNDTIGPNWVNSVPISIVTGQ
jgi:hypothetical protein